MTEKEFPQTTPNESITGWTAELIETLAEVEPKESLDINAIKEFISIISHPDVEEEWQDTYSTSYTVKKILEASNTYNDDEDLKDIVRRKNSIEVLTNIYSIILKRKPELAETVVDTMIEKLKSERPENMIFQHGIDIENSNTWIQEYENYSLLDFFLEVSKYPTENRNITKKALEALIETWDVGDFSAPKKKSEIILNIFKNTPSQYQRGHIGNEIPLNREILHIYLEKIKKIKKDSPNLLNEISSINSSLLSLKGDDIEDNLKREHLFQATAYLLKNNSNPQIRKTQIETLKHIVEIEDKKNTGWGKDHLNLTDEIFFILGDIVEKEIVNRKEKVDDKTVHLYESLYNSLGYMFTRIYKGDDKWKEFFTNYNSEILETFNNYIKVIETPSNPLSKDINIIRSIYKTLDSILPLEDLAIKDDEINKDPFLSKIANIKGRLYIR
jgi:hypothetical protein